MAIDPRRFNAQWQYSPLATHYNKLATWTQRKDKFGRSSRSILEDLVRIFFNLNIAPLCDENCDKHSGRRVVESLNTQYTIYIHCFVMGKLNFYVAKHFEKTEYVQLNIYAFLCIIKTSSSCIYNVRWWKVVAELVLKCFIRVSGISRMHAHCCIVLFSFRSWLRFCVYMFALFHFGYKGSLSIFTPLLPGFFNIVRATSSPFC